MRLLRQFKAFYYFFNEKILDAPKSTKKQKKHQKHKKNTKKHKNATKQKHKTKISKQK